jgi:small-conductance mechanosensitive channel
MDPKLLSERLKGGARVRARKARAQAAVLLPAIVIVGVAYAKREALFGVDLPVRIAAVVALLVLGWALARDIGHAFGPSLLRRLDPSTAGTMEFVIRLAAVAAALLVALRIAGLKPETLAVGGAVTAVIFGLAAQQTIGNLIAGVVLLSARPFVVGEVIRLQAGGLAGQTEGTVVSLGLLYTTLYSDGERIMVPNSIVLSSAVVPLKEPRRVDVRVKLEADARPSQIERALCDGITVKTRDRPRVALEYLGDGETVMHIQVTPEHSSEGAHLTDEVLDVLAPVTAASRAGGTW